MTHLKTLLVISVAALSSCASVSRIKSPVELQGKAIAATDGILGQNATLYTQSTRYNVLLMDKVNNTSGIGLSGAITALRGGADDDFLEKYFLCNPLKATYARNSQIKALKAFGKSLEGLGKEGATTLAGQIVQLQKDYTITLLDPDKGAVEYEKTLTAQCAAITKEVLAPTINYTGVSTTSRGGFSDPDLKELYTINAKAYDEGIPLGADQNAALASVVKLATALAEVMKGILVQIDQNAREKALKEFFGNDNNNFKNLQTIVTGLDQAMRSAELGERLKVKEDFRRAWLDYTAQRRQYPGGRVSDTKSMHESVNALIMASTALDKLIRDRTAEAMSTNKTLTALGVSSPTPELLRANAVKVACEASGKVFCFTTGAATALEKSIRHTKDVAQKKWSKMTPEEKAAYFDSLFATITALDDISTKLATFENDKENFVLLNSVIDDLP